MSAYVVMALGAFVVSIIAGLSGAVATPISRRTASKASGEEEPVKPQLPPEVMAILSRNALRDGRGDPLDQNARKHMEIRLAGDETCSAPSSLAGQTLSRSAIVRNG
jgi:hypothetical protein